MEEVYNVIGAEEMAGWDSLGMDGPDVNSKVDDDPTTTPYHQGTLRDRIQCGSA